MAKTGETPEKRVEKDGKPGPKPARLKIEGEWKDAIASVVSVDKKASSEKTSPEDAGVLSNDRTMDADT
jgi:hypothetical protein